MTAKQYRAAIEKLWPSQAAAAAFFKLGLKTVNGRANGRQRIPEADAKLLRLLLSGKITIQDVEEARR